MFPVTVACDCPSTSCPTHRRFVLFAAGSCLELNWTEHSSATMYVVKDSGACLFCLVVHVCRTVDCVVGVLAGTTDVP